MISLIIVLIGGYDGCVGMSLGFCVAQAADDLPFGICDRLHREARIFHEDHIRKARIGFDLF